MIDQYVTVSLLKLCYCIYVKDWLFFILFYIAMCLKELSLLLFKALVWGFHVTYSSLHQSKAVDSMFIIFLLHLNSFINLYNPAYCQF